MELNCFPVAFESWGKKKRDVCVAGRREEKGRRRERRYKRDRRKGEREKKGVCEKMCA